MSERSKSSIHKGRSLTVALGIIAALAGLAVAIEVLSYASWFLARTEQEPLRDTVEPIEPASVPPPTFSDWEGTDRTIFKEPPGLRQAVAEGALPPVAERLPERPQVVHPPEQMGPYGGTWRYYIVSMQNMTPESEPLVRFDPMLKEILPSLATDWEITDGGKTYIFHLRKGIRWSDGHPFTAEDIVFGYQHVIGHPGINPYAANLYKRGGKFAEVDAPDQFTVRFRFSLPHGLFLQHLAHSTYEEFSITSYPAHYMKQFHPDFVGMDKVVALARSEGFAVWEDFFKKNRGQWDNPERPTLSPWRVVNPPPARPIRFERNPYYWKVDPEGNQLPYIDFREVEIYLEDLITLKILNGDVGVQVTHLDFASYPIFMANRDRGNYRVFSWQSSEVAGTGTLLPNLNHRDPVVRGLMNDRRFRMALSHAVNRRDLNELIFYGLGEPRQPGPSKGDPYYRLRYAKPYTEYDPELASQLLDEMGLTERDGEGFRVRPDGGRLSLTIDSADFLSDPQALQMIADDWRAVGLRADFKLHARILFYERTKAREHDVAINGDSTILAPVILNQTFLIPNSGGARHAIEYFHWYRSNGTKGSEPPPEIRRAFELYRRIEATADPELQDQLVHEILEINARNLWMIGLVGDVPALIIVNDRFRNVPTDVPRYRKGSNTAPEAYAIMPE